MSRVLAKIRRMRGAEFLPIWTGMMAAMMLPSTVPLLRLDYATTRSAVRAAALAGGYLLVWIAFGGVVLAIDAVAGERLLGMHGRRLTAALLALAALYQLLPMKQRCLRRCRAPLGRLLLGWRDGVAGAARMGVTNGLWCAGCCVGLLVALLALGVMSWGWMILVGAVILVEKVAPFGARLARPLSVVLAVGAIVWAL
jgi:predicted metal-binding membrane protein